jgi:hypothetical protein
MLKFQKYFQGRVIYWAYPEAALVKTVNNGNFWLPCVMPLQMAESYLCCVAQGNLGKS